VTDELLSTASFKGYLRLTPWEAAPRRRMDYVTEVLCSKQVGHYSSRIRCFGGLQVATRRGICRRNPDNIVNLNQPSITLDIGNVELHYTNKGRRP
jgi:hypothetical protein